MKLLKLLKKLNIKNYLRYTNHKIFNITDNHSEVKKNSVFVCIIGANFNGHDFIIPAINNGAKTIIIQERICNIKLDLIKKINIIKVENTKKVYANLIYLINKRFFKNKKIVGITGTNGKTSTSTLIHNYLEYVNKKSVLIGSNGIFYKSAVYAIKNTTPSLKELVDTLKSIPKLKYKYIIMEVSSISIKENRITPLNFNIGVFTNLTIDHLDYHKSMTDYRYSKLLFLKNIKDNKKNHIFLNSDDETSFFYYKFLEQKNIWFYSIKNAQNSDFSIKRIKEEQNHTLFTISDDPTKVYQSNLFFDFSLYNLITSYLVIKFLKISLRRYDDFIKKFKNISGRIDFFYLNERYILIDFAHTPDGVKNILKMIDKNKYKKIRLIIGCGGNRDKLKRPIIGNLAVQNCDFVTFTNDNPRNESEKAIIMDIIKGIPNYKKNYEVIYNRKDAIKKNVLESKKNEIIIILGKGSEQFQIIKNEKIPFNDKEVVLEVLKGVKND